MMMHRTGLTVVLTTLYMFTQAKLPLDDATATVDKLFTYSLDPADFPSSSIKIIETGTDTLPTWLHYDEKKHELIGIPSIKDKGTYILSANEEVFAVTVTDSMKNQVAEPADFDDQTVCKPSESITVVYVKMNTDSDSYKPEEKTRLVRSISSKLSLKPDHITLKVQPKDLQDSSLALVSGSGDAASPSAVISTLSWIVGCGAVKSHHMDILEELEAVAKNGELGKLLGIPVNGWQVQSEQAKFIRNRRLKRDVKATSTPVPGSTEAPDSTSTTQITQKTTQKPTETTTTTTTITTTTKATTTSTSTTKKTTAATPEETTASPVTETGNKKPEVNRTLVPGSLSAYNRQLFRWTVPNSLFNDPENEELTLSLEDPSTGNDIMRLEPWFVQRSRAGSNWEVVGLPSASGMKEFALRATDESGASSTVTITVRIKGDQIDSLTEVYSISVKSIPALRTATRDLYLALTLSAYLDMEKIVLKDVKMDSSMFKVSFGDNRGYQTSCPEDENRQVEAALKRLVNAPVPLIGRNSADSLQITSIDKLMPVSPCKDTAPSVNLNQIRQLQDITVVQGQLYEKKLSDDLFMDREDGNLKVLKLKLLADGSDQCQGWLCLDKETRTLQALTWTSLNSPAQFELVVMDSAGNEANEEIEASVVSVYNEPTHMFTLTMDETYSQFANSLSQQVKLYKAINKAFPGSTITISSVKEGSVILQYQVSNDATESVPGGKCPTSEIKSFTQSVFDGEHIKESFSNNLESFNVEKIDFAPQGVCEGEMEPMSAKAQTPVKEPSEKNSSGSVGIIIAVVIVVVILITIIVVVIIVIRKRNAKRGHQRQTVTIEKGVPTRTDEEMKDMDNRQENQPLMADNHQVNYIQPNKPPAYPNDERRDGYQPPTPPVSEPDEHRELDKSL